MWNIIVLSLLVIGFITFVIRLNHIDKYFSFTKKKIISFDCEQFLFCLSCCLGLVVVVVVSNGVSLKLMYLYSLVC